MFAARSAAPAATVVTDGVWCFGAVQIVGADHERVVTGGGKASTELPQFKAINTFLGNLKCSLSGTYHVFDFVKYAHRYLAEAPVPVQPSIRSGFHPVQAASRRLPFNSNPGSRHSRG